jgi:hypothetical protein
MWTPYRAIRGPEPSKSSSIHSAKITDVIASNHSLRFDVPTAKGREDLIEARRVAVIHEAKIFLQRCHQFRLTRFSH